MILSYIAMLNAALDEITVTVLSILSLTTRPTKVRLLLVTVSLIVFPPFHEEAVRTLAISLRTLPIWLWFDNCCVATCILQAKLCLKQIQQFLDSIRQRSFALSSLAFITNPTVRVTKVVAIGKLSCGKRERLTCQDFVYAVHLVQYFSRLESPPRSTLGFPYHFPSVLQPASWISAYPEKFESKSGRPA
jgi:hypothetical protein